MLRFCYGSRRRRVSVHSFLIACALFTGLCFFILTLTSVDPPSGDSVFHPKLVIEDVGEDEGGSGGADSSSGSRNGVLSEEMEASSERGEGSKSCATVEQMGESFKGGNWSVNLCVRRIIQDHFALKENFCKESGNGIAFKNAINSSRERKQMQMNSNRRDPLATI